MPRCLLSADALRIPADAIDLLRVALASEPAITGRTFTGQAGA